MMCFTTDLSSGCRGVTFKAINLDSSIGVAAVAKVTFIFDGNNLSGIIFYRMTVDTFFEAELFCTYTIMHGVVALMEYVLHMINAHLLRWLYALFRIAFRYYWAWYFCHSSGTTQ
jgi:hypothetical protein